MLNDAKRIMRTLIGAGYEAYMVGGFVRDRLLNKPVQDIDIATSATPADVMRLFPHTVATGLQHGTVTVVVNGRGFEVTTFRREGKYTDHRRPDHVEFVDSLQEDLSRRDFTINAMAMDENGDVIDPFGGREDLAAGILRCVGDARERFKEDALRMLRCIRFAAGYRLQIEPAAWSAIMELNGLLKAIAMERVRIELTKTVAGADPVRGMQLLCESRLLHHAKVPLNWHPVASGDESQAINGWLTVLNRAGLSAMSETARWASLFLTGGHTAEDADSIMRKLTFSNEMRTGIVRTMSLYQFLREQLSSVTGDFYRIRRAWLDGAITYGRYCARQVLDLRALLADETWFAPFDKHAEDWLERLAVWGPGDLELSGRDLTKLAASRGPWMGRLLHTLAVDAGMGDVENRKDALLARAVQYMEMWGLR